MPKTIVTGLDIGTSSIRLVVCEPLKDNKIPRVLAQIKTESHGLRRGYLVNFDETLANLRHAVAEAERQTKTRIKNVILGIGGVTLESKVSEGQVAVSRADLEITENDLQRAQEASEHNLTDFANRRVIHSIPLGFKLDGKKVLGRPEGLKGQKLEVKTLFIHCLQHHVSDLMRLVTNAGLVVEDIVAAPLAASFPTLTTTQKTAGCVLANIGSQTTSIVTFEDNVPISLQVFPLGSNDVTNDIALGLRVSIEEAEKMKVEDYQTRALGLRKKLDEIIEARLSDMFELIDNHLKKIGRNGLLPAGIIIVGGGAKVEHLERLARDTLKLPAKIFDPHNLAYLKNQIKDASWVVAYGLCLFGLGLESEESFGVRLVRSTKQNFLKWLRELLP